MLAPVILLILSALMLPLVVWVAYQTGSRAVLGTDVTSAIHEGNGAVGLLLGSLIWGGATVVVPVLEPAWRSLVLSMPRVGGLEAWLSATAGQVLVVAVCWVALVVMSTTVFDRLTRGAEERASVRSGNLAAAWVLAGIIVAGSQLVAAGVGPLLDELVPYPDVGMVEVLD